MPRQTQQGFSLLEAMVAMVLIATFGMAIYAWVDNNARLLRFAESSVQTQHYVANALAYLEDVNPAQTQSGEAQLGDASVAWQSQQVRPLRDSVTPTGGQGLYRVGLYATRVTVSKGGELLKEFTIRQVGYKQVYGLDRAL